MINSKVEKIVESIYLATINGNMKWSLKESIFNSDSSHRYTTNSLDGFTKFDIQIELQKDLKSVDYSLIQILNDNIIDKNIFIQSSETPYVASISNWIFEKYIKGVNTKNQDSALDDIFKGIDITEYRDKKIDDILSSDKNESTEKGKNPFFKRFFN